MSQYVCKDFFNRYALGQIKPQRMLKLYEEIMCAFLNEEGFVRLLIGDDHAKFMDSADKGSIERFQELISKYLAFIRDYNNDIHLNKIESLSIDEYVELDGYIDRYFSNNKTYWVLSSLKFFSELFSDYLNPDNDAEHFWALSNKHLSEIARSFNSGSSSYAEDIPTILYFIKQYVVHYKLIRHDLTTDVLVSFEIAHRLTAIIDQMNDTISSILQSLRNGVLSDKYPAERELMIERDIIFDEFYRETCLPLH